MFSTRCVNSPFGTDEVTLLGPRDLLRFSAIPLVGTLVGPCRVLLSITTVALAIFSASVSLVAHTLWKETSLVFLHASLELASHSLFNMGYGVLETIPLINTLAYLYIGSEVPPSFS